MAKKKLHKTIRELHAELKKTKTADKNVHAHIQRLLLEIDALSHEPGEIPLDRYRKLLERLRESAQHFEQEHLSLSLAVGRVIDALSNMGI